MKSIKWNDPCLQLPVWLKKLFCVIKGYLISFLLSNIIGYLRFCGLDFFLLIFSFITDPCSFSFSLLHFPSAGSSYMMDFEFWDLLDWSFGSFLLWFFVCFPESLLWVLLACFGHFSSSASHFAQFKTLLLRLLCFELFCFQWLSNAVNLCFFEP